MDLAKEAIDLIRNRFADSFLGADEHAGQAWAFVERDQVITILAALRDELACDFLMDLTAVDYLNRGMRERFVVVYQLYSLKNNQYFRLKTWVPEADPVVDTAGSLWKAAPWAEREIWDMFGITFRGNNDMRRILCPYDYSGHPLRKDYPLVGEGERQNFTRYTK